MSAPAVVNNKKSVKDSKDDASSGEEAGGKGDAPGVQKGQRRRKDGTVNKMSFDVDELEEGLYVEVEDEEDVEEVIEYEEVPDDEAPTQETTDDNLQEGLKAQGKLKAAAAVESAGYKIRPDLSQKFRPGTVSVLLERAITEKLEGKEYSVEECEGWVQQILEDIHEKVKSKNYKRYKLITQVTLGERRGEGASSATRCLWDAEADCMATYTFLNDTIFCNGTVYGVYYY